MGREARKQARIATTKIPPYVCPACGRRLEATTGATIGVGVEDSASLDRPTPRPGSVSICGYCGELLIFDSGMRGRLADRAVAERLLAENPFLAELQNSIRNGDFTSKGGSRIKV